MASIPIKAKIKSILEKFICKSIYEILLFYIYISQLL